MTDNDMIRDKAIFIKLNQLHFSDQQLFDMAVSRFDLSRCTCPTCGSIGQFRKFYSYERSLITISEGKREEKSISVSRFLCESCNHTHALLPDILIPYGSYSLRFILTILLAYLKRTDTVAAFCEHWHISVSTLYAWIHLFVEQYNAWCRILDRILWVSRQAIETVSSFPAFPSGFLSRFGFSFLQNRTTPYSGRAPLSDRRRKQPST